MKKIALLASCLHLLAVNAAAAPWAVVGNMDDRTINTIDIGTVPPTVYGPFLGGQFHGSDLLDVAITPDGRSALVSLFFLGRLYRIDLTDPTHPTVTGLVSFVADGFFAEDIAIAANGHYALVTDGTSGNRIAIIDLPTFTLTAFYTLTTPGATAQAVAITPDSRTAIACDYDNDRIIFGNIDPAVGLTSESVLPAGGGPLNVAIAPNGRTALVSNNDDDTVSVYKITSPGVVTAGTPSAVTGLPGGQSALAFSPDGQRAFVVSTVPIPNQLSWLQVSGPGKVALGGAGAAELLGRALGGFFGIDALAVYPNGQFALVGNVSNLGNPVRNVSLVNLTTWAVSTVPTDTAYPAGIDIQSQVQGAAPALGGPAGIACAALLAGVGALMLRRRPSRPQRATRAA